MAKTIKPEQLSEAIQTELKNYTDDVIKGVKNESKRAMDNLVSRTKATAPVGSIIGIALLQSKPKTRLYRRFTHGLSRARTTASRTF